VDIGQLARQYTVGEVDPVRATLQAYFKTRTNVSAFRRAAPRALRDESDNLAAALLLEAAIVGGDIDIAEAVAILELACQRFQKAQATAFELQWHLTALAWLQAPPPADQAGAAVGTLVPGLHPWHEDAAMLRGDDFPKPRQGLAAHLTHAQERFPYDLDLRLMRGRFDALRMHSFLFSHNVMLQSPQLMTTRIGPSNTRGPTVAPRTSLPSYRSLRRVLSEGNETQRSHANLLLGYLQHYHEDEGLREEAPRLLEAAAASAPESEVRYLARIFLARVIWSEPGGLQQAAVALQEAMALHPEGQTASRLMATFLFLAGKPELAGQLVEQSLAQVAPADPWWSYLKYDYQGLAGRLQRLREMLSS
jgi:hypothetical protein